MCHSCPVPDSTAVFGILLSRQVATLRYLQIIPLAVRRLPGSMYGPKQPAAPTAPSFFDRRVSSYIMPCRITSFGKRFSNLLIGQVCPVWSIIVCERCRACVAVPVGFALSAPEHGDLGQRQTATAVAGNVYSLPAAYVWIPGGVFASRFPRPH